MTDRPPENVGMHFAEIALGDQIESALAEAAANPDRIPELTRRLKWEMMSSVSLRNAAWAEAACAYGAEFPMRDLADLFTSQAEVWATWAEKGWDRP